MTTRETTLRHHPDVERWRSVVEMFWSEIGRAEEVDYALALMWGESQGQTEPELTGLPNIGLYQHAPKSWDQRARAAQKFWNRRGVDVLIDDPLEPMANIAVAAWLRHIAGYENFPSAQLFYPEGSVDRTKTVWDGYSYQDLLGEGAFLPQAPRGDGRGGETGEVVYPWIRPVGSDVADPHGGGFFGDPRDKGTRRHGGIDFVGQEGEPIYATADGLVEEVGWLNDLAGYGVRLDHGGGWTSSYLHQPENGWTVKVGQTVGAGQQIGTVGDTGNSATPHLHFSLVHNGTNYDPIPMGVLSRTWEDWDASQTDLSRSTQATYWGQQDGEPTRASRAQEMVMTYMDTISRSVANGPRRPLVSREPDPDAVAPAESTRVAKRTPDVEESGKRVAKRTAKAPTSSKGLRGMMRKGGR